MTRQDSSFYTDSESPQTVWKDDSGEYFAVRNGEIRLNYTLPNGDIAILRYTSDLDEYGIDSDEKLYQAEQDGKLEFINNSWFEVWNKRQAEYYSEVLDTLDDAIQFAKEMNKHYGDD
jgi:hypothetical protein